MLLASGANFGFRRTIPHIVGINVGFSLLLLSVGFMLGAAIAAFPPLLIALKVVGGIYLLSIAWTIAKAGKLGEGNIKAEPISFLAAVAFQWVNPKGWVMAMTAAAAYSNPERYIVTMPLIALAFAIVNIPSASIWTGFGSVLREWLSHPGRLKWFNISLAVLLVLSLWPMLR
jgi:threonine/homoserine/homoserine lactone efflux protein